MPFLNLINNYLRGVDMRFSEFGNYEIKEHTNYTTELIASNAINIFDPKLHQKMAEQGKLRLMLLNKVNHMAEEMAKKDSGMSQPFNFDQSFEEFLDFRKRIDNSFEAFLRLHRLRSSSK